MSILSTNNSLGASTLDHSQNTEVFYEKITSSDPINSDPKISDGVSCEPMVLDQALLKSLLLHPEKLDQLENSNTPMPSSLRRLAEQISAVNPKYFKLEDVLKKINSGSPKLINLQEINCVIKKLLTINMNRSNSNVITKVEQQDKFFENNMVLSALPPQQVWPSIDDSTEEIKPEQLNALLDQIIDKKHPIRNNTENLVSSLGRASMDQLIAIVASLVIKTNVTQAKAELASQKIQNQAADSITQKQLTKQLEAEDKAAKSRESAKKGGLLGTIFSWVSVAIEAVVCVVAPIAIPLMVCTMATSVGGAICDTLSFSLGDKAPAWLSYVGMGLSILSGLCSVGPLLMSIRNIPKLFKKFVKCMRRVFNEIILLIKAPKESLCMGAKAVTKGVGRLGKNISDATLTNYKNIKNAVSQPVTTIQARLNKIELKLKDSFLAEIREVEKRKKIAGNVATMLDTVNNSVKTVTNTHYVNESNTLLNQSRMFANDSWFLELILTSYQQQKDQRNKQVSDLYQRLGESLEIQSRALSQKSQIQERIASSIA